jgi:hypothetical protein
MEPIDGDQYEEAADLDVRRLKRMLEKRDDATREFQRVKAAILGYGNTNLQDVRAVERSAIG